MQPERRECCLCLSDLRLREFAQLHDCGHNNLCAGCIASSWKQTCPYCRQPVFNVTVRQNLADGAREITSDISYLRDLKHKIRLIGKQYVPAIPFIGPSGDTIPKLISRLEQQRPLANPIQDGFYSTTYSPNVRLTSSPVRCVEVPAALPTAPQRRQQIFEMNAEIHEWSVAMVVIVLEYTTGRGVPDMLADYVTYLAHATDKFDDQFRIFVLVLYRHDDVPEAFLRRPLHTVMRAAIDYHHTEVRGSPGLYTISVQYPDEVERISAELDQAFTASTTHDNTHFLRRVLGLRTV